MKNSEEGLASALSAEIALPHFNVETDFAAWAYNMIKPYLNGRLLELDSGDGTISSLFVNNNNYIHLSDPSKSNRDALRLLFKDSPYLRFVHNINPSAHDFLQRYSKVAEVFDTVVSLRFTQRNPIEGNIINLAKFLLRENGHLIFITPAFTTFFNEDEQNTKDLKRYNISALRRLLSTEFQIMKVRYFNYIDQTPNEFFKHIGLSALAIAIKK